MKKNIIYILIVFVIINFIVSCCIPTSNYTKHRIYDSKGNYIGYSIENTNGSTRYYDKHSNSKGYSK